MIKGSYISKHKQEKNKNMIVSSFYEPINPVNLHLCEYKNIQTPCKRTQDLWKLQVSIHIRTSVNIVVV
jgi:hypothetical protein